MSDAASCDNCQFKECDLSDCMSRGCAGGPNFPKHSPVKPSCPLPEIGSAKWNWTAAHIDAYFDRYESECSPICVISTAPRMHIVDGVTVAMGLATAFRIAELLTRLEWAERHGKKLGI